jgi:hypothetical protein
MTPKNSKKELEKRIKRSGKRMADLTLAQGIWLMLNFYRDVRAEGCVLNMCGDMLLFLWGTDDWGQGRVFTCEIMRHFIVTEEAEDGYGAMSLLSLTFHFTPSARLETLREGKRWCSNPQDLANFEAHIARTEVCQAVAGLRPNKVTLEYGEV